MSVEQLIEKIVDIKKELNLFEDELRDCDELNEDEFICLRRYKDRAYDELTPIKDILLEIEYRKREGDAQC